MVVVTFLLIFLLVSIFVPPMMKLLVVAEHETYLARASSIGSTIEALRGQTPLPLLLSLSLDGIAWLGQRGKWRLTRRRTWSLVTALVSMCLVDTFLLRLALIASHAAISGVFVLDLVLTLPASLLGYWLASTLSQTIQTLRR